MTTQPDDWEQWRAAWAKPSVGSLDAATHRAARARRQLRMLVVVEFLVVAAVVGVIAAAVSHAANLFEAVLAVAVAAGSLFALARQVATRRTEARLLSASLADYPALLMALRRREIGASRLTMLVVGALLVFLVLWWSGGLTYHRGQAFTVLAVGLFWVPMAGAFGLLTWSVRIRRSARDQLEQLTKEERPAED